MPAPHPHKSTPVGPNIRLVAGDNYDPAEIGADLIVMEITRSSVESGLTGDIVTRLMRLTDNPAAVASGRDKMLLMFEGYDADPRELYEIPEVVRFFRAVSKQWPYWWHFAVATQTVPLVLRLLCDVECVTMPNSGRAFQFVDLRDVERTALALFVHMNTLYEAVGIGESENRARTDEITSAISNMFAAN